ncbi:MAG: ABC transporter ATP-binding protein [Desulfobacterales bacterium]|nr:ABC transporter ATP-binding protein [Desulfobacterales bacterium]MDJ0854186.1 ABC transporter ATP-binding protein [Desulfobacterales bacterium]MDJ0886991.1 ABC transporter ATP-binding protein [Desulfobacterales bacterium]MDJ0988966.1 ABC transporter ATP-binding protein [Desulfobacterales bacterium]
MNTETLVQVRGLQKCFASSGMARIEILQGIELDLRPAESLAIVGASGIGKSTLLHILGTLDRPDSGSIRFRGVDVFAMNADRLAGFRNRSIGFVFQFHHLLPEFTTLENVMMPALIGGLMSTEARRRARDLLTRVDLAQRLSHRVTQLSGGEQQRVALARALVTKPQLLLADEPTGNLDKHNGAKIHRLLMALNRELGMTLVVVTHNPELADLMDRRVTIVDGRLVELE